MRLKQFESSILHTTSFYFDYYYYYFDDYFFIAIFATQKSHRVVNDMRIFNYLSLFQAFG